MIILKIQVLKSQQLSEYLNANRNELFGSITSLNGVTNRCQSPAVTSGVCHIMDAQRYGAFYNRQQVSVQVGYDGTDFSEGQRTAICVQRGSISSHLIQQLQLVQPSQMQKQHLKQRRCLTYIKTGGSFFGFSVIIRRNKSK